MSRAMVRGGWWRAWALVLLGWLGVALAAAPDAPETPAQAPQWLTAAMFAAGAEAGTPWTAVELPDDWRARGLARPGAGRYRLNFERPEGPQPWALWSARWPNHHRLWVNGVLLADSSGRVDSVQPQLAPALLPLPATLLRPGRNELELELRVGLRAGLGAVVVGPAFAVEQIAHRWRQTDVELPRLLNLLGAGACLFALLMWWWRRSERALGWFAALGLLLSLRNFLYYETGLQSPAGVSHLLIVAQAVSTVMFGSFAMAVTQRPWPRYRNALLIGAAIVALVAPLAGGAGAAALDRVRLLAYPLLSLLALPAVLLLLRHAWTHRRASTLALALAGVAIVISGVHDYLYQAGWYTPMGVRWLPFATPALVLAYVALTAHRLVAALGQVEVLNLTLEQRVQARTAELSEANAAKTRFLAAASHDLRQPVVTIGLLTSLLREQVAQPALRALVARLDAAAASLETLLGGLLDLSRLESGAVPVRLQAVALQPLFETLRLQETEPARQRGLVLRVRRTEAVVLADPLLLEQALRNLVGNAVRYTERGGVLLAARRTPGGQVRLQVWDTGRGIPPHQQAAVFDEFVQLAPASTGSQAGVGLGLAIVRRAAAALGATLGLRSEPGRGSCFSLTLQAAAPALAPAMPADLPATDEPACAGLRVLLVEDDPAVRDALRLRLQSWGAEVQALADAPAVTGETAPLVADSAWRPDLMISDLHLPHGDGPTLIARAREHWPALPALLLTGSTAASDRARLAGLGLPVLHKPFRADELRTALRAVLDAAPPTDAAPTAASTTAASTTAAPR